LKTGIKGRYRPGLIALFPPVWATLFFLINRKGKTFALFQKKKNGKIVKWWPGYDQ
jgi:hypothetical protein